MKEMRSCVPAGQFSIKCRLGWENTEDEFPEIMKCLAAAGPDEVGIHARTRRQLYGGSPDFSYVTQAVQNLPCPVLANGDLNTPEQATECLAETGASGLMLDAEPYAIRIYSDNFEEAPPPHERK